MGAVDSAKFLSVGFDHDHVAAHPELSDPDRYAAIASATERLIGAGRRRDLVATQAAFNQILDIGRLDDRLLQRLGVTQQGARIDRFPIDQGLASIFLNRVEVVYPTGIKLCLVEKGMKRTSPELQFWLNFFASVASDSDVFEIVQPVCGIFAGGLGVLYFPFIDEIGRIGSEARPHFRRNLVEIAEGIGHVATRHVDAFNDAALEASPFVERERNIDPEYIQAKLKLDSPNLAEHLATACRQADRHLPEAVERLRDMRATLVHNDVGPGNAFYLGGELVLLDFGMAGTGPAGSDLHSIIRWGGDTLIREDARRAVIESYLDGLQAGPAIDPKDVEISLWTVFYLRYTNLKWKSARNLDAFVLAIDRFTSLFPVSYRGE